MAELQKQAGANTGDAVKNFLATLAANNRLGILKGVCDKFGELMAASRGEVEMVVTSATVRIVLPSSVDGLSLGRFWEGAWELVC